MICSSAQPASGLWYEFCRSSLAADREALTQLPTAEEWIFSTNICLNKPRTAEEWTSLTSNGLNKPRTAEEWTSLTSNGLIKPNTDRFLSPPSPSATVARSRSRTPSLQILNPCWPQQDPIPQGFPHVEVGNGELSTAGRGLKNATREIREASMDLEMDEELDIHDGHGTSSAEHAASYFREACIDFKTNADLDEEYLKDGELDPEGVITNIPSEESIRVNNSATNTHKPTANHPVYYVNALKKCAKQKDLLKCFRLHADLIENGLIDGNTILGNALIDTYAQCGNLDEAVNVFYKLQDWSVASWNTLVSRYVQCGLDKKALCIFECMQLEGFSPNAVTFSSILKAFGSLGDVERGQQIHAQLKQSGLLETNVHVGTALVDMYAKCGLLSKAQDVFDKLPIHNVVSWTALIIGYTHHDLGEEALRCFEHMLLEGFYPDEFTFACAIKACCSTENLVKGRELHAWAARERFLEKNSVITSALVDMYAKCGELELAGVLFNSVPCRDKVSWSALINGYAQYGYGEEALINYEQMLLDGFVPNEVTLSGLLKACTSLGSLDKGQYIHAHIIREGLLNTDIHLGTALVDMYGKFGLTFIAEEVFENLAFHSLETWTAIITAFVQCEEVDEAFHFFKCMQVEGIYPDAVTFSCLLIACGSVAASEKGQQLHLEIVKLGLVEEDTVVGTSLVDMYANCGMLLEAQDVFDKLDIRDLVTWNVLIGGYAQFGKEEAVFELIDGMVFDSKEPNDAIFTLVLNACSHGGLMDKAQSIFTILSNRCVPSTEQYTCMIDLFGRAGLVEMAAGMVLEIPFCPNLTLWSILLTACRKCGTVEIGRWSFDQAILQEEKDSSVYICMYIIYAAAGRQQEAAKIAEMQNAKQAWVPSEECLTFLID